MKNSYPIKIKNIIKLVILLKKNNLFFCIGREDTIIKLKGHRVDLVEIESLTKK